MEAMLQQLEKEPEAESESESDGENRGRRGAAKRGRYTQAFKSELMRAVDIAKEQSNANGEPNMTDVAALELVVRRCRLTSG